MISVSRRLQLPIISTVSIFAFTSPVFSQQYSQSPGQHMWYGGWHAGFFGPLMMIVLVVAVVLAVVLLVRYFRTDSRPPGPPSSAEKSPMDILKERFARGEIDKDDYHEKLRTLEE